MSDFFDNSISIDDILAEFHAENTFIDKVSDEDASASSRRLGDMDLTMEQVQKNVPTPEEAEAARRRSLPSEEEVRAYMAGAIKKDYLNIVEDINPPAPNHEEIDRRFRVDGKPAPSKYMFDGEEVEADNEGDYIPSVQEVRLDNRTPSEPLEAYRKRQRSKNKVSARKRNAEKMDEVAHEARVRQSDYDRDYDDFTSYSIPIAEENVAEDYPFEEYASAYDSDDTLVPGTFKGYLAGIAAGILYKLKGGQQNDYNGEEADDDEYLGREVKPLAASKYYGSFVTSLRLRFRLGIIVWLVMLYVSCGLPVPGILKDIGVCSMFCVALQLLLMLICLDTVVNSVVNIGLGRAGIDLLAVVSCIVSITDGIMVTKSSSVSPHMPFCVLSSLSLLGVQLSSLLSARGLRKAMRVPAIGKSVYSVTGERALKDRGITLLKSVRTLNGFVRRAEEAPLDEDLFAKLTPFILGIAILFSVAIALLKDAFSDFLFIFAAILSPAVPCAALLSFAFPFFIGSMRIFNSGAAIAGWSGLCDVGQSKDLIVTDRDIFPKGTVEIDSVRIFADGDTNKIISYAGSMMAPSGMASSPCFVDLMKSTGARKMNIENIEFLPAGGVKGIIQGERVLCGNVDLMRLMNVRVPSKLTDKNSVLLAVDGVLYGIFNIKYTPLKKVRAALTSLIQSNRHAVFAIRDFNVTPDMLSQLFDIATDGYVFPPYLERFELSAVKANKSSKIAAVVCRESLGPLVDMADAGRSMYVVTNINTCIALVACIIGLIFPFVSLLSAGTVTVMKLLVLMLIFALPVPIISFLGIKN